MLQSMRKIGLAALVMAGFLAFSSVASAGPIPAAWTCVGSCGEFSTTDGVVTVPTASGFNNYQWISTNGGVTGAGILPTTSTGQETDGSFMQTNAFAVQAGDELQFDFNYITSDGASFTEYAWAGLYTGTTTFDDYLFTARTTSSGDTVPGFSLPGLKAGVTLTPPTTPIIGGGPAFSPLGSNSGSCYSTGCGYTGWITMNYTFTSAGTVSLGFGVTNALDTAYDSAFAVSGITINDVPVGVPEPGMLSLLTLGMGGMAALRRRRRLAA